MTKKPRKGSRAALQYEFLELKEAYRQLTEDRNSIRRAASDLLSKNFELSQRLVNDEKPVEQRIIELQSEISDLRSSLTKKMDTSADSLKWKQKYEALENNLYELLGIDKDYGYHEAHDQMPPMR